MNQELTKPMREMREREILALVREAHPDALFKGFRKNLLRAFGSVSPRLRAEIDSICIVPDFYFLREREVVVYEVVVWHDISTHKFNVYGDLKQAFKAEGLNFELWRFDRYGSHNEIPLTPLEPASAPGTSPAL